MDMYKIATHDSATGEKGMGLLSWLVTPFAKTQSKTIKEQYEAGCRSFDLRVKKAKGDWHCAHGLWKSCRTFKSIIEELAKMEDRCQVCVTYEGKAKDTTELEDLYHRLRQGYKKIIWGPLCVKYGPGSDGVTVKYSEPLVPRQQLYEGGEQGFLPLDGRSWHTYFPIPWLWDRLYKRPHKFDDKTFTYVDFL